MAALLIRNKYDAYPHDQAFEIANQFIKVRKERNEDVRPHTD